MESCNDNERYAFTLILISHPSKAFSDERVYAAHIWFSVRGSEVKKYEREINKKLDDNRSRSSYPSRSNQNQRSFEPKVEKTKRERNELKQRAFQFLEKRREYYKGMANGPEVFPLNETLRQIEQDHVTPTCYTEDLILELGFEKYSTAASELQSKLDACNLHLLNLKKREACEIIIWGTPSSETLEEIGFFEQQKQRAIDNTVEVKRLAAEAKFAETKPAELQVLEREAEQRKPLQID